MPDQCQVLVRLVSWQELMVQAIWETIWHYLDIFPSGSDGKESACNAGDSGLFPGSGRSLEKGMATYSSVVAWRTPWTEETGGLQFMGLQRVGPN